LVEEEIKRRLNLAGATLLCKSINIRIKEYSFACGFVWMQNFVSDVKGRT
jgi:hypothetical protein